MSPLTRREREIGKLMRDGGLVAPSKTRTAPCRSCGATTHHVNGAWLRWYRHMKEPRMSLRSFAASLKLSPAYISDIEHDRRRCTTRILQAYEDL